MQYYKHYTIRDLIIISTSYQELEINMKKVSDLAGSPYFRVVTNLSSFYCH